MRRVEYRHFQRPIRHMNGLLKSDMDLTRCMSASTKCSSLNGLHNALEAAFRMLLKSSQSTHLIGSETLEKLLPHLEDGQAFPLLLDGPCVPHAKGRCLPQGLLLPLWHFICAQPNASQLLC